jgi:hypothetical protein
MTSYLPRSNPRPVDRLVPGVLVSTIGAFRPGDACASPLSVTLTQPRESPVSLRGAGSGAARAVPPSGIAVLSG